MLCVLIRIASMSTHNIQFHDKVTICFLELAKEFELAIVNEPWVFELLRFDCRMFSLTEQSQNRLFGSVGSSVSMP